MIFTRPCLLTLREKLCDKLAIVEIQSYNNDDVEHTLSIHNIIFVFRVLPLSLNPGLATPNLQSLENLNMKLYF